jgi:hypothetical protein
VGRGKIAVYGSLCEAALLGKIPGETYFDIIKGLLSGPGRKE